MIIILALTVSLLYHRAHDFTVCMRSRFELCLRKDAKIPPIIWGRDHIDEGHRKQWAAEL